MASRILKSHVPLFAAGLVVSLVGCSNIPNPFSSSYTVPPLLDSRPYLNISNFTVDPQTVHPGQKFYVRGLLQSTSSATISVRIVGIAPPTASLPVAINTRPINVPSEGILLAEEFLAPSDIGTYSVVIESGNASAMKNFEVTPQ